MIEEVLDHYGAQVVRSGSIRCPFHDDSHASGSINLDKELYFCFVCGVGGDAIAIIRWREDCDYPTAVTLAETISGESLGGVRRQPEGQSGYGLPPRKGNRRERRKYVPAWLR